MLHDSADNIRDAKETQHLRKIKVVDKQESKPSNLHVGTKRKVVDGDYSADSAKRFKSSGLHHKHKSNNQDRMSQSSVADIFQKKGPRQLGFVPRSKKIDKLCTVIPGSDPSRVSYTEFCGQMEAGNF